MNLRACTRIAVLAVCLGAGGAGAAGVVTVSQPWTRPARLHAVAPAYLELGTSEPATLVAVRSPVARVSMMRGKAIVDEIVLKPGMPLAMTASREHLMLHDVGRKLGLGERVPLTLVLRDTSGATQEIDVSAEVRLRSPIDDERRAHTTHSH